MDLILHTQGSTYYKEGLWGRKFCWFQPSRKKADLGPGRNEQWIALRHSACPIRGNQLSEFQIGD